MLLLSQRKKIQYTFVPEEKDKTFITKILNFEAEKTFCKRILSNLGLGHYMPLVCFSKEKKVNFLYSLVAS